MTFIEFKKLLLDAEISLPKFSKLIKVSEKNLQSYKKKGEVPKIWLWPRVLEGNSARMAELADALG